MNYEEFKQFITSPVYRRHWRRTYAESEVRKRRDAVNRHVYVQELYYFSDKEWRKKSYICIDGCRLPELYLDNVADREYLAKLRKNYYLLHRHTILKRMD